MRTLLRDVREPHGRSAAASPRALHRHERIRLGLDEIRLLIGSQHDHARVGVRMTERGEDLPAHAEIRVVHVGSLSSLGERECEAAEFLSGHEKAEGRSSQHGCTATGPQFQA